jgi:Fe-S oxidoreductase
MIDTARRLWREVMDNLHADIKAGTPIIGLEPACVSSFRDELIGLFPADERAKRLSKQTLFLTEFLDQDADGLQGLTVKGRALVQIHCHQHAVLDHGAERRTLDNVGLGYAVMKSGCCGMAGSFGFEASKYNVSMSAAERVLLPQIRSAPPDTLVLANGFSCREQIEQGTGRRTLHVAELLSRSANA